MEDIAIQADTVNNADAKVLEPVFDQLNLVLLGKPDQLRLAMTCLLAQGHLLIEDVPGLGKTVLAHALGQSLGLSYKRVQFTSDLLPGDIIGTSIFDPNSREFRFNAGPVFTQLFLADEINRTTPKSQSALLEAMEERRVSIEGTARKLPEPFFVIATQNPTEHLGTFPLPESQLDRFLMRIELGYPTRDAEFNLFRGEDRRQMLEGLKPAITTDQLLNLQKRVNEIHAGDAVLEYLYRILEFTRQSGVFHVGLSTRSGLGLLKAARAWALINGEDKVLPGDIQAVLPAVAGHRLQSQQGNMSPLRIGEHIIEAVPIE